MHCEAYLPNGGISFSCKLGVSCLSRRATFDVHVSHSSTTGVKSWCGGRRGLLVKHLCIESLWLGTNGNWKCSRKIFIPQMPTAWSVGRHKHYEIYRPIRCKMRGNDIKLSARGVSLRQRYIWLVDPPHVAEIALMIFNYCDSVWVEDCGQGLPVRKREGATWNSAGNHTERGRVAEDGAPAHLVEAKGSLRWGGEKWIWKLRQMPQSC